LKDFLKIEDISFSEILNSLNLDENTYIISLSSKLKKGHMFFKQTLRNKKTNALSTCVTHVWFVNIDIQFIFRPICNYNILQVIHDKIDKSITSKLHSIIQSCMENNINASIIIQKLGNVFINVELIELSWLFNLFILCFLYHYIIHFEHFNSSILFLLKNVFLC